MNKDNDIDEKEETVINRLLFIMHNYRSDKAKEYALNFKPPKNSYYISTYLKCGTTMTQQICHQLRSKGDMEFEEITYVIPYVDAAYDHNIDIYKKQKFEPHIFKTHLSIDLCPKDVKFILVWRNPYDVANSYYHFFCDWFFEKNELSIDTFVKKFFVGRKTDDNIQDVSTYFSMLLKSYQNRHNENVLWLYYEDYIENFRACALLLAEFLGLNSTDNELIDIAEKQSTREFMFQFKNKFDDAPVKIGINLHLGSEKYKGVDGQAKVCEYNPLREKMSESGREAIKNKWLEVVKPVTGFESYEEMRMAINKEFNRHF